jgi:hypothetical protein
METVLHTMYVIAIKDTSAWDGDSPAELSMIGLWNLVVVWMKVCSGCRLQDLICSCSYLGDTSVYGHCWMAWTHRKT